MGNKPYVLDGLLSWLSRLSKSVQTMILLESFLRLRSVRGREGYTRNLVSGIPALVNSEGIERAGV